MTTELMAHQREGVRHIIENRAVALFDEQGTGKSKQAVEAACRLFLKNEINCVVVVCPAAVRGVWDGLEYGQIKQHSTTNYAICRWDKKPKWSWRSTVEEVGLEWYVTSYSFLRNKSNVSDLVNYLNDHKVMLVLDESHYIKNRSAQQSKGAAKLAEVSEYRVLLSGTPYANDVTDLWHQLDVMDHEVWPYGYWSFRATFAKLAQMRYGDQTFTKVVGVKNKERLDQLTSKKILRRLRTDCVDLPPKVYSVVEVAMSEEGWGHYESMRDELLAWVEGQPSVATNAGVRVVRLSQITSGFVGGIRPDKCERCGKRQDEHGFNPPLESLALSSSRATPSLCNQFYALVQPPVAVDRSKLDAYLEWRSEQENSVVTWSRFTAEIERLFQELKGEGHRVGMVYGRQTDRERQEVVDAFQRGELDDLIGNPQAGGVGLNLMRSHTVAYLSNDYSLVNRLQSEDRTYRVGQREVVTYTDFLATSPSGGKTVDHLVLAAVKAKINLAAYTMEDWRKALAK